MPPKKKTTRKTTRKSASTRRSAARPAAPASPTVATSGRQKMLFTRDEEHQILVSVVDKFLLFGFAMVGVGWFWLTTRVLELNPLQETVLLSGFGILVMLLIFSLISRDYEFRRDHVNRK